MSEQVILIGIATVFVSFTIALAAVALWARDA